MLSAIRAFEPIEVQDGFSRFSPSSRFRTSTLFLIVFVPALRLVIGIPAGCLRPRSVLRFLHGHGKSIVVDQQGDLGLVIIDELSFVPLISTKMRLLNNFA